MADNKEQEFKQKIILILEERMKGSGKVHDVLNKTAKVAGKATASTGKYAKTLSGLSKTAFMAGKAFTAFGIALKGIGIAIAAVTAIAQLGKKFVLFAAQTGKGAAAVRNLRDSYKDLQVSTKGTLISLRDLTEGMGDFASQSFTQLALAGGKPAQEFVGTIQNALTKAVGSPQQAKQMTSALNKAFASEPILLQSLIQDVNSSGGDLGNIISALQQVDISIDDRSVLNVINALKSSKTIGQDASSAFLTWSEVVNKAKVAIEDIGEEILVAFGGDLKLILESAGGFFKTFIITPIKESINLLKMQHKLFMFVFGGRKAVMKAHQEEIAGLSDKLATIQKQYRDARKNGDIEKAERLLKLGKKFNHMLSQAKARSKGEFIDDLEVDARENVNKTIEEQSKALADIREQQRILNELTKNYADQMKAAVSDARNLTDILKTTGKEFLGNNEESIANMVKSAKSAIEENRSLLAYNNEEIKIARQLVKDAGSDESQRKVANRVLQGALGKRSETLDRIKESYQVITNRIELGTQKQQNELDLLEKRKTKMQTIMDMSKALYGSASLAVDAQMQIIGLIETEKRLIEEKLHYARIVLAEDDLLENKKKVLDLENQLLSKQKEQLEIARELKDGYLDAIQASAFGAGRFEKILITQEKNLGQALDKNIAKKNIFLGQSGVAASAASITPFKFSGAGIGSLSDTSGAAINSAQRSQEFINNIQGPQAAIAQASHNLVAASMNANTEALQRNTDVISKGIHQGTNAAGVGSLKGTAAGSSVVGESMRTGKNTISSLSGGPAQSKVNRAVKAITNDLIPALQGLARLLDDQIASESTATRRQGNGGSPF